MKQKKKQEPSTMNMVGNISFLVGIIVAFVTIFFNWGRTADKVVFSLLILIGLVIGFVNISAKEAVPFMVAVVALVLLFSPFVSAVAQTFQLQGSLSMLGQLYSNLAALFVPAALLVALRTFVLTSKDE